METFSRDSFISILLEMKIGYSRYLFVTISLSDGLECVAPTIVVELRNYLSNSLAIKSF